MENLKNEIIQIMEDNEWSHPLEEFENVDEFVTVFTNIAVAQGVSKNHKKIARIIKDIAVECNLEKLLQEAKNE